MKQPKEENKNIREKIIHYIENKGSANLVELKKLGIRQTVQYNIRNLCKDYIIRAHIEGTGLKDDEIFFTIVNRYEHPQYVKRLIDQMCYDNTTLAAQSFKDFIHFCETKNVLPNDAKILLDQMHYDNSNLANQGFNEFVHLCETKNVLPNDAKKLAHALMADIIPGLKEKVAFELSYKPDPNEPQYGFQPKNWITNKNEGRIKRFEDFVSLTYIISPASVRNARIQP
jgi:hypothetical protein